MNTENIESVLMPYGLRLRGIVLLDVGEVQQYGFVEGSSVALVGNIGSSFWPQFIQSKEYRDGLSDPLDRWSIRVAGEVSSELNTRPVFPFQGPPYLPFQQWAKRAEALHQSPIGLMIHPQYGLWHAYRFALVTGERVESRQLEQPSPCLSCATRPCLNSCPVNAFSTAGYDVERCADYLRRTPSADCFEHGCMARYECPAGRQYRYADAQSRFHLQAFIDNRPDQERG